MKKIKIQIDKEKFKAKLGVKDGSPDTGEQIVEKINELPLENEFKIDAKHIKNLPKSEGRGYGGGLSRGVADGLYLGDSFETVYKNLKTYPVAFTYSGSNVTTKVFTTPTGTVTATFAYSGSNVTSITLSGSIPSGISTVKSFTYSGSNITNITYA
jgi:hypothetical protein